MGVNGVNGRDLELINSARESEFLRIRKRKLMKSECQKCWKQKSAINDDSNGERNEQSENSVAECDNWGVLLKKIKKAGQSC